MKKAFLGNLLVVFSICLVVFIYFPYFAIYLFPTKITVQQMESGIYLNIPKISASAKIIENVDPWDENKYKPALKLGVAEAEGFGEIGQSGTIFIFAHSSEAPWNLTRFNTAFFRLPELDEGDLVEIYKDGMKYEFKVFDKREVWPHQVEMIKNVGDVLILQTCTPVGTSLKRLLVFASPIS